MRFEKCLDLFRRVQPAIDQLQKDLVQDILVGCQLGRDAHLLHLRIGNSLPSFRPRLEEELDTSP